jgi:hypothetical protein
MSKGQKPDPRRKKTSTPSASYWRVPNGGKEIGYLAGQVYGCYGHRVNHHKPCLIELTGGEVACPWCGVMDVEWRGYVPVWDQDWTLKYCLIPEDYLESVDMIPHRARIVGTRAPAKMSPIVIRTAELPSLRPLPDRVPYTVEIDMYAIARKLWKIPALDAWYARTQVVDNGRSVGAPPLDPSDFSVMNKAAVNRVNEMEETRLRNEQAARDHAAGKPLNHTNGNGKHKAKKEE